MEAYPWLKEYLLAKPGVTKDFKIEWEWHRYMVGGKMFAAFLRPSEKYDPLYREKDLLTLKCDPLEAELLRDAHEGVLPGFYMDKRRWNSVDLAAGVSDEMMKQMVDSSYQLVFTKLTKKLQREITEAHDSAEEKA